MAAPSDPRDLPLPPPLPPGPRDRLPPNLAKYCPDATVIKQRFRLWSTGLLSFLQRGVVRVGKEIARRWCALGRKGKSLVLCGAFAGVVLLILGIASLGGRPEQASQPQSAGERPTTQSPTKPAAASQAEASRTEGHLPTGWVRIVNRGTGTILHAGRGNQGPFRIDRAGDYYLIRSRESGRCLALAGWASKQEYASKPPQKRHQFFLSTVADSASLLTQWRIEPIGDGFWRISNRATGKSLEIRKQNPAIWQSQFRDGSLEQQWQFEAVADSNRETSPATDTPIASPNTTDGSFRLVAVTDLIWLPDNDLFTREELIALDDKRATKRADKRTCECTDGGSTALFRVFRGDEGPKDGFFDVGGKPVAPIWKSSNPSVLELKSFREIEKETHVTYLRGGENLITIRGAGKATVTVSIGDLSLRANLEVLHAPVSLYMSRHELLKKYGFPLKKYQWRFGTLPAGFEELPRGCCGILRWTGFRDQGTNVEAWKLSDKRGEGLSRDDVTGEYWEYPQWPRCLILVGEQGVKSIVTLPAKTPVGTETASNAGKVQKPGGQESSASISALELWQEYGSNALAADAKYKNGQVVMSGGVHDIGRAKDGRYYVGFYVVVASAVDEFTYANMSARERKWWAEGYPPNVVCYLAKDAKEDFAGVQPGDKIRVRAKVVGMKQTDDVWQGYLVELENGQLIK